MASEVKADKLSPSGGTALQIGDASDTITIPTGATFTITDGLGVASGGTGLASFTAGDILYASGTTTLSKLAKGTAEQVLAMNSGATAPDWGSVDLTVLPTITAAKGGTGQTSYTTGDTVYASGSTAVSKLGIGTARQALQTNSGATAPEWVNSPQSLMTAEGDILYASGANTLAKLAKGSDDEVLTLASGVPSWAAAGTGGKILQIVTVAQPAVVSISGDSNWNSFSGLTVAITPTAASSKIFITGCFVQSQANDSAVRIGETIDGGSVAGVLIGNQIGSNRTRATSGGNQFRSADESMQSAVSGLVSPTYDITEELTYTWQGRDSADTMYTNREVNDTDNEGDCTGICTLTVMEVAA